jgi:hypothetical protein
MPALNHTAESQGLRRQIFINSADSNPKKGISTCEGESHTPVFSSHGDRYRRIRMLEGGHNQERQEPALVILPAAVFLVGLVAGCTVRNPVQLELVRPVKTMVIAWGNELQTRTFPGKVEASKCRVCSSTCR